MHAKMRKATRSAENLLASFSVFIHSEIISSLKSTDTALSSCSPDDGLHQRKQQQHILPRPAISSEAETCPSWFVSSTPTTDRRISLNCALRNFPIAQLP